MGVFSTSLCICKKRQLFLFFFMQAITHRRVHRKSSAIMYSKILERTFGKLFRSFELFMHFAF